MLILRNLKSTLEAITYFQFIGEGFVSPKKIGQNFPAALILQANSSTREEKEIAARRARFNILYYDKIEAGESINELLNEARERIIGNNIAGSDFFGGLKEDPTRGGTAQWTFVGDDQRGPSVFLHAIGLSVGLYPPWGAGMIPAECPYFTRWR
jgi:hypothetical protein